MLSNGSRGALMSYTDHSIQRLSLQSSVSHDPVSNDAAQETFLIVDLMTNSCACPTF